MGGFDHLLSTLINLNLKKIDTNLTLKCIDQLVISLCEYMHLERSLMDQVL